MSVHVSGDKLVTGSIDKTAILWDLEARPPLPPASPTGLLHQLPRRRFLVTRVAKAALPCGHCKHGPKAQHGNALRSP